MSELRTPEVENLLSVFAKLNDNDTVFALLEDLFTIREIRETSQRLAVARLLSSGKPYSAIEEATGAYVAQGKLIRCYRKGNRCLCDNHRPRVEVPLLRVGRLRRRARGARR